jgi:uncharacterized membrane protein YfcA
MAVDREGVESVNESWKSPQTVIAVVLLMILGGTVGAVFWFHDAQTVSQTVGGILAIAGSVAGYYFGSTASSHKKDETISTLTGGKQ